MAMSGMPIKKAYIDSRFKTKDTKSDPNFNMSWYTAYNYRINARCFWMMSLSQCHGLM